MQPEPSVAVKNGVLVGDGVEVLVGSGIVVGNKVFVGNSVLVGNGVIVDVAVIVGVNVGRKPSLSRVLIGPIHKQHNTTIPPMTLTIIFHGNRSVFAIVFLPFYNQ